MRLKLLFHCSDSFPQHRDSAKTYVRGKSGSNDALRVSNGKRPSIHRLRVSHSLRCPHSCHWMEDRPLIGNPAFPSVTDFARRYD